MSVSRDHNIIGIAPAFDVGSSPTYLLAIHLPEHVLPNNATLHSRFSSQIGGGRVTPFKKIETSVEQCIVSQVSSVPSTMR